MGHISPDDTHQTDRDVLPNLFSFITFRRENFGGFLFNPYLFNELSLNNIEMCIVEHCNGRYSLDEITEIISQEFLISHNSADQWVSKAFKTFNDYYAINWNQQKQDTHNPITTSTHLLANPKITNYQTHNLDILSAPISILWEITHKCNLRCKHCLIDAGEPEQNEITLEELKVIIKQLAEMKVFKITFGGGEPLVRPDFLDILHFVSRYNFGIKITTNGTLVNNDLLKKLKTTKVFSVQVSIDGLEQTHNTFRGSKNSFKNAINALKLFSDAGYWTIMSTAVSKYNFNELEALIELAIHCGATSFKASPFIPIGRGEKNIEELKIPSFEMKNLARKMVQKKKEYIDFIDLQIDGFFPWLLDSSNIKRSNVTECSLKVGCSAGVSQIVITPSGDILPCPFFRDFNPGNIRKSPLKNIWKNSEIFNVFRKLNSNQLEGECKNCEFLPHDCQGGCRASAFAWTGNLFAQDPHCWKNLL
ncbi:MAG: radical SAM protein [Candidatus Hodarchaeota archaeon]